MSDPISPTDDRDNPGDTVVELAVRYLEGELSVSQRERFNALLAEDAGSREAFGNLCTCAYLLASSVDRDAAEDAAAALEEPESSPIRGAHVPGLLGSGWNATVSYLAQPGPLVYLAYLFAAVLCGLGLLAGSMIPSARPPQLTGRSSPPAPAESNATIVARITGSVGCDWADPTVGREGTGIPLDSALYVASGRLEIRYNIGVKVVIQGPAVFAVDGPNSGFLRYGNVLVQVEPGEQDGRAKRGGRRLTAARPGPTNGSGLPAEPAANPLFCVRYSNDPTSCHTIMSDRGAEFALTFALGEGGSASLAAYVLKGPVWTPQSERMLSTTALLQGGSSLTVGIDKNGASRVAVAQDKPPAALLRGLLEGNPSGTQLNYEHRRGS